MSPKCSLMCSLVAHCSSTEAAAACGPAGGFGSNVAVAAGMASQEPPTVGSVSAEPDRDHLQAKTDEIVAECINNILDEVTPEEVAAQTPGQNPEAQVRLLLPMQFPLCSSAAGACIASQR